MRDLRDIGPVSQQEIHCRPLPALTHSLKGILDGILEHLDSEDTIPEGQG